MSDPTLTDLLTVETADALLEFYLTELSADFPVNDWLPLGVELTTLAAEADAQADAQALVVAIAKGGLLGSGMSAGDWLTLLAASQFSLTRNPAVSAVAHALLTNASGAPYTITPGMLKMTRSPADGHTWESSNTTNQTLPASGTLSLDFRAESPGGGLWNLTHAEAVTLSTPLAGVTVALVDVGSSGQPMTTTGAEAEDDAALTARCQARWGALAWAGPSLAYEAWAREADAAVTKVYVDDTNPDGPGTSRVYFAGTAGGVASAAADAVIQARKPESAIITTQAATTDNIAFAATIYCQNTYIAAAKLSIYAALRAIQTDLPIGDGAGAGAWYRSKLIEIFMDATGVVRVDIATVTLAGVASDYTPAKGHIAQLSSLTDALSTLIFTAV